MNLIDLLRIPFVGVACGMMLGCRLSAYREADFVVKGRISDAESLRILHPQLAPAFEFLKTNDLSRLSLGRYAIKGDNVYAMVLDARLDPWCIDAKLEAHRRYIDIHVPVDGTETIGYAYDEAGVRRNEKDYSEKTDCVFFRNASMKPIVVAPGEFVVFYPPYAAHSPGLTFETPRTIRKVVVKVAHR